MEKSNHYFKKILIVEDDAIVKYAVKTILEDIGFHAELASNGQEALIFLQEKKFDLILSDINMPIMDGYELAKKIRASNTDFKHIPIIGITAQIEPENIQKAKMSGMNEIFTKPINITVLKKLLHTLNHKSELSNI